MLRHHLELQVGSFLGVPGAVILLLVQTIAGISEENVYLMRESG